jgi:hypothetical protein
MALTIRQPYAYCVAIGAKTVENRPRPTRYRGLLAVHAGKHWASTALVNKPAQLLAARHPERLVLGAVIATTELVDCHLAADGCCAPWGAAGVGVWHWVLQRTRPLPVPVPAVGQLGFWPVVLEPLETLLRAAEVARDDERRSDGITSLGLCAPWFERAAYETTPHRDLVRLAQILVDGETVYAGRLFAG